MSDNADFDIVGEFGEHHTANPDPRNLYTPVPVVIQTDDMEVQGLVHVERSSREERKISEWLNDPRRRFMAVTDAQVTQRNTPCTPVAYDFLMIHVDSIVMLHPLIHRGKPRQQDANVQRGLERLQQFREKLATTANQK